MRRKLLFFVLAVCMLLSFTQLAQAAILFEDLGTAAPPATVGIYTVTPFDQVPQTAIPNFTDVTTIPGSPIPGDLNVSPALNKRTIGAGWATWSHGYAGAVYATGGQTITMTLPPATAAFYFYAEPNQFADFTINATADDGTTSGDITVNGSAAANGYAFYSVGGASTITSITVTTSDPTGFAIGEFGAAEQFNVPTMNEWGMIIFMALAGLGSIYYLRRRHSS
ncbi:MAG: IPTL-CTERM sorting domain-containing protein [Nitrospirae bacterium]|nr:IPTL-CTERM sorting domain-containing protein [Nitrospirota bacterium]